MIDLRPISPKMNLGNEWESPKRIFLLIIMETTSRLLGLKHLVKWSKTLEKRKRSDTTGRDLETNYVEINLI